MAKKKKQRIGMINGLDMLKKTRGINTTTFRGGAYLTEKDRPRDKNWKKWNTND